MDLPAHKPHGQHPSGLRRTWKAPKPTGYGNEYVVKGYLIAPLSDSGFRRNVDADYFADASSRSDALQDAQLTYNAMMDAEAKVWVQRTL